MSVLLSRHHRFFLRHELQFTTPRQNGLALPLQSDDDSMDVLSACEAAIASNEAKMVIQGDDVLRLTRIEARPDDEMVVFLFRRRDPNASVQYYEHRNTRAIRRADRQALEDPAVSCHLFVRTVPSRQEPLTYRAILEEIPGIGRTYIQMLIGDLLRDMKYHYTDRRGHEKETYTIPSFHGIKTESIGGALELLTLNLSEQVALKVLIQKGCSG